MRTTPEERKRIKKQYRHHKDVKLIRSKTSVGSSSILSRDDADVPTKEGIWIPVKLYGRRRIYQCPSCKALVKQTEYFCPICGAENSRQYTSITIKPRRIPDDDGGVGVRRPSPDEGFDWDEFDESFSDTMPRW
jgi:hypothetical protein